MLLPICFACMRFTDFLRWRHPKKDIGREYLFSLLIGAQKCFKIYWFWHTQDPTPHDLGRTKSGKSLALAMTYRLPSESCSHAEEATGETPAAIIFCVTPAIPKTRDKKKTEQNETIASKKYVEV